MGPATTKKPEKTKPKVAGAIVKKKKKAVLKIGDAAVAVVKRERQESAPDVPAEKKRKIETSSSVVSSAAHEAQPERVLADDDREDDSLALSNFRLSEETIGALSKKGIKALFPIQAATFDLIYDGRDLIGRARTGMGKTLAFSLPIVQRILELRKSKPVSAGRAPITLVMAPTRELAQQVSGEFASVAIGIVTLCVYGGSPMGPQCSSLRAGIDVLVGTPGLSGSFEPRPLHLCIHPSPIHLHPVLNYLSHPCPTHSPTPPPIPHCTTLIGRIKDLAERGALSLTRVQFVTLDEADQMLDMGFADDMTEILALCTSEDRQTCLFSATLPAWVREVAPKYMLTEPKIVDLVGDADVKASEDVRHVAVGAPGPVRSRTATINDVIQMYASSTGRVIVFCQTKAECDELANADELKVEAKPLHGDIPQGAREKTMAAFRSGKFRVLVATDVAARGLDMVVELVVQNQARRLTTNLL